jgi:hypothetical protein
LGFLKLSLCFCAAKPVINTLLVPKDGEIPVDIQRLAAQGIIDVVCTPLTICFD